MRAERRGGAGAIGTLTDRADVLLGCTARRRPTFTYYDVLGVSASATHAEVREAYRRLALQAHPDRVAGSEALDADDAELLMRAVNEAWHVLGDPVSRASYDAGLARTQRVGGAGRASGDSPGDQDDWGDREAREQWPAERATSALVPLVPLLLLVGLLALIVLFTAYAKTG